MNYRDYLQQLIYKIINPLIHGMIKIGITPNFITTTGFILNVVAACCCRSRAGRSKKDCGR